MKAVNPFHSLYITEKISPEEYVGVMSPLLVPHSNKLFISGNVVIQGTQGSGKTTLLALLKPEIRIAYIRAREKFPVENQFSNYISPGINLLNSGILDFGKRPIHKNKDYEEETFPLFFADFFNYYLCIDLFESINKISSLPYINLNLSGERLMDFVRFIKNEDCWFGYLSDINTFSDLTNKLAFRKSIYRKFHQFNIHEIPQTIIETKTSIGEPISRIARALKKFEIIPNNTEIYIRVDQIETTLESDGLRESLGEKYRRMLNSALVKRDPSISYKIGSRTYAWKRELRTYNSNETIEENRSYTLLDVDEMLRRRENSSSHIFPQFARDIFTRRLKHYKLVDKQATNDTIFKQILGKSPENEDIARQYCNTIHPKSIKLPSDLPQSIHALIQKIYKKNPLEGILATAWCLQGKKQPNYMKLNTTLYQDDTSTAPWNKKWWRKERLRLALMQLASNHNQSIIWGGSEEVMELGKDGVLCFLSLCQHIWGTYLRTFEPARFSNDDSINSSQVETIPISVQTLGIVSASKQWVDKIDELPGGSERRHVVEALGRWFRNKLLKDIKMTYPGHTGFSLKNSDFETDTRVKIFLQNATDYGILREVPHTSKEYNAPPRKKWYFNSIYYPFLKLYEARIKEPYYANLAFINAFLDGKEYSIKEDNITRTLLDGLP